MHTQYLKIHFNFIAIILSVCAIILLIMIGLPRTAAALETTTSIRAASWNILVVTLEGAGRTNEHIVEHDKWVNRKHRIVQTIEQEKLHIIGFQEFYPTMRPDMRDVLPQKYGITEIGDQAGTYNKGTNAISWDTTLYNLVDSGDLNINTDAFPRGNATASDGSTIWVGERWLQWAKFTEIKTGQQFYVFNLHLDSNPNAIASHIKLGQLQKALDFIATTHEGLPTILMGDFNNTGAVINGPTADAGFANTRLTAAATLNQEYSTYSGWNVNGSGQNIEIRQPVIGNNKIDHVFFRNDSAGTFSVDTHETILAPHSDHLPIMTTFSFRTTIKEVTNTTPPTQQHTTKKQAATPSVPNTGTNTLSLASPFAIPSLIIIGMIAIITVRKFARSRS